MSSEERATFEAEWVGFRDEVYRRLDLEFSIRLALLGSDERVDTAGNVADGLREGIMEAVHSRSDQVIDDLFNRSREEGVGYFTYAMFQAHETANRLALEVIKSALKSARREIADADLPAALGALAATGRHWPLS